LGARLKLEINELFLQNSRTNTTWISTDNVYVCLFFQSANQQQKDMIEHAASVVSEENTELACSFIQKTAVEKVLPEMDKRLATVSVLFPLHHS